MLKRLGIYILRYCFIYHIANQLQIHCVVGYSMGCKQKIAVNYLLQKNYILTIHFMAKPTKANEINLIKTQAHVAS